jgi:hypothetical protein
MTDPLDQLYDRFPFLTYGTYLEKEYIGIVQNSDHQMLTMYIYNLIFDEELKKKFLICGETWWWESNRLIPINVFLKDKFKVFKPFMRTFVRKEFAIIRGPVLSLQENMVRRIKRRQIQLIKKMG